MQEMGSVIKKNATDAIEFVNSNALWGINCIDLCHKVVKPSIASSSSSDSIASSSASIVVVVGSSASIGSASGVALISSKATRRSNAVLSTSSFSVGAVKSTSPIEVFSSSSGSEADDPSYSATKKKTLASTKGKAKAVPRKASGKAVDGLPLTTAAMIMASSSEVGRSSLVAKISSKAKAAPNKPVDGRPFTTSAMMIVASSSDAAKATSSPGGSLLPFTTSSMIMASVSSSASDQAKEKAAFVANIVAEAEAFECNFDEESTWREKAEKYRLYIVEHSRQHAKAFVEDTQQKQDYMVAVAKERIIVLEQMAKKVKEDAAIEQRQTEACIETLKREIANRVFLQKDAERQLLSANLRISALTKQVEQAQQQAEEANLRIVQQQAEEAAAKNVTDDHLLRQALEEDHLAMELGIDGYDGQLDFDPTGASAFSYSSLLSLLMFYLFSVFRLFLDTINKILIIKCFVLFTDDFWRGEQQEEVNHGGGVEDSDFDLHLQREREVWGGALSAKVTDEIERLKDAVNGRGAIISALATAIGNPVLNSKIDALMTSTMMMPETFDELVSVFSGTFDA